MIRFFSSITTPLVLTASAGGLLLSGCVGGGGPDSGVDPGGGGADAEPHYYLDNVETEDVLLDLCETYDNVSVVGDVILKTGEADTLDFSCLTNVAGRCTLNGVPASEIDLSGLRMVLGSLQVVNTENLERLEIGILTIGADLGLRANESLKELHLDNLEEVARYQGGGGVQIFDNEALEAVHMPKLERVQDLFQVTGAAVIELEVDSLTEVGANLNVDVAICQEDLEDLFSGVSISGDTNLVGLECE